MSQRDFPFGFCKWKQAAIAGEKKKERKEKGARTPFLARSYNEAFPTTNCAERIKNDLWQRSFYAWGSFKAFPRSLIIFVRAITRLMRGISKEFPGNSPRII